MTAAPAGPTQLFPTFSGQADGMYRTRHQAFLFSLLGQALILGLLTYFTCCLIGSPPRIIGPIAKFRDLPLVFSGSHGGGGGNFDKLPASRGNSARASLDHQIVPPNVMKPTEMPKLPAEETVRVAPEVKLPEGGQVGDPMSHFSRVLSNGPGGPGGIGPGCCNGIGDSIGPYLGSGLPGIFPAGRKGVTVPQVIYNPEPSFSDEARKAKVQGVLLLLLVVGKDGRPMTSASERVWGWAWMRRQSKP